MEEYIQPDLFEVRLNKTGVNCIKKLSRLSGVIFFLVLASTLFYLFLNVKNIMSNSGVASSRWNTLKVQLVQYTYLIVLVGNFIAVLFYIKFIRSLHYSIQNDNEVLFNRSFRYILRNAAIFIGVLVLNIVMAIISIT